MNSLNYFPGHVSSALPFQSFKFNESSFSFPVNELGVMSSRDANRRISLKLCSQAISGSTSSTAMSGSEGKEEKSDTYSHDLTEAMGAVLTYRHELGMNYNFIHPDLIVGSCLQTPEDVDKLHNIGVKTIFCLQQDTDLEYFGVDICSIRAHAKTYDDIEHLRADIRGFDAFDLRMRLPAVVSKLYKAINRNGGITYVHCTAGLGRAPAVAVAYMFWVQSYKLEEAHRLLQSKCPSFPNLDAIKSATADILTGLRKGNFTLTWEDNNCSRVEVSGLDIGWGQRIPLTLNKEQGLWVRKRELPEGRYEYKYIVDGEWTCNKHELITSPNRDGHMNNYVIVLNDQSGEHADLQQRLVGVNLDLTKDELMKIRQFLETFPDDKEWNANQASMKQ